MKQLLQPHEAAAKVGIADSTLRTWAPKYAAFLSDYARRGRRTFTKRDVAVLSAIKAMADENMTHEAIMARLPALDFPDEAQATPATDEASASDAPAQGATMALVQVMATSHSAAIADQAQRITQQDAQLAALAQAVYSLQNDVERLLRSQEAAQRLMEALQSQLADLEGKVSSVGGFMHGHTGPVQWFTRKEG